MLLSEIRPELEDYLIAPRPGQARPVGAQEEGSLASVEADGAAPPSRAVRILHVVLELFVVSRALDLLEELLNVLLELAVGSAGVVASFAGELVVKVPVGLQQVVASLEEAISSFLCKGKIAKL